MTSTRGPGRPPTFSSQQFVATAIEAIEERGVANLTMRDLAERLGAAPSAAYRHVADKEQLMLLVVDEILGQVEVPETGAWHERLVDLQLRIRVILKRYPGVSEYIVHVSPRCENSDRLLEAITGLLREGGLDDEGAYRATLTMYKLLAGDLIVGGVRSQLPVKADTELFVLAVNALLRGFGLDVPS